jgi:hypothetical protein
VIRCDPYVIAAIESIIGTSSGDYDHNSISVQCGKINLHLCASDKEYDRWEQGTRTCRVVAPVDRETAKKLMAVAGVDRGASRERKYSSAQTGAGKVGILREDGTLVPWREWNGYK